MAGRSPFTLAFALLVIPSALWLEATIFHMENDYAWTPILVVGVLILDPLKYLDGTFIFSVC